MGLTSSPHESMHGCLDLDQPLTLPSPHSCLALPALSKVVVIVRHGDRAPITRTVGSVIKDSPEEQAYWIKRLPPGETVARLSQIFPVSPKLVSGQEPEGSSWHGVHMVGLITLLPLPLAGVTDTGNVGSW